MKTEVNVKELIMLDAMKNMRQVYTSKAEPDVKENMLNKLFFKCMKVLDEVGVMQ